MIPGNASAAFILNFPSSNAKALSLDLSHTFRPASSLGRLTTHSSTTPTTRKQCFNEYTNSHPNSCEYGINRNSLLSKQHLVFSANEVLLSDALAIISLKLVVWFFSLPLRILIDSCLTFKSSFRVSIHFIMSYLIASS